MPNWLHLFVNGLYHLGLALWIGGAVALGALSAPVLFGALPRQQAGSIFGPTLRRFAKLRLCAVALMIVGAGAKHIVFESFAKSRGLPFDGSSSPSSRSPSSTKSP